MLRASGSGSFLWVLQGIEYASGPDVHADVINMSLGATFDRINRGGANGDNGGAGPLMAALSRAINHATQNGTLVVSAAGNEAVNLNGRLVSIPAQSGNGMAVSATAPIGWATPLGQTGFDFLASYSNIGHSVVNVAAPGGDTSYPGNENCTQPRFPAGDQPPLRVRSGDQPGRQKLNVTSMSHSSRRHVDGGAHVSECAFRRSAT